MINLKPLLVMLLGITFIFCTVYFFQVLLLFWFGLFFGLIAVQIYLWQNVKLLSTYAIPLIVGNTETKEQLIKMLMPSVWFSTENNIIIQVQDPDSKIDQIKLPVKKVDDFNYVLCGKGHILQRMETLFKTY